MHETACLSDAQSALSIEYSRTAMEQIRARATAGLMAAPRVGMGIGGLLLGVREVGRIRLLDSIEIPCSHSAGPSFNLTPDEMQQAREMLAEAGAVTSSKVAVVGWYCSKTRGDAVLNEADLKFNNELFSGQWQLALIMRPSAAEPMRAVFFFRDENGAMVRGVEGEVEEWRPVEEAEAETETTASIAESVGAGVDRISPVGKPAVKVIEFASPVAVEASATRHIERPGETTLADIIGSSGPGDSGPPRPRPIPAGDAGLFGIPGLRPPMPLRRRSRLFIIVPVAAAVLAVAGAAYYTQESWLPKPQLTMSSTELNGSLLIRWNAEALRGIEHASMFVNDGGTLQTLPLDRFQLESGLYSYTPRTQRVTAKLSAGDTSAITLWFATPPPDPAAPPTGATPGAGAPQTAPAQNVPARPLPTQDNSKTARP
jgi:proteasome lid subunit RPN8/RPN11